MTTQFQISPAPDGAAKNSLPQRLTQPTPGIIAVDDEPLALARLECLIRDADGARLVASTCKPAEALDLVARWRPDILLLDIEMPGINGLELANRLNRLDAPRPLVIFISASDHHAISAFEAQALDYILKPVTPCRLKAAIERARQLLEYERSFFRVCELERQLQSVRAAPPVTDKERDGVVIWALQGNQFVPLRVGDIERAESERDYVHIHNNERAYLLRMTLGALHERLGFDRYVRVRRSVIVRLDRISAVRNRGYGDIQIVLQSGAAVQVGRTYLKPLRQRLSNWHRSHEAALCSTD